MGLFIEIALIVLVVTVATVRIQTVRYERDAPPVYIPRHAVRAWAQVEREKVDA